MLGLVPRGDEVPEYATSAPYATDSPYATTETPYVTNPQLEYATNFESPSATPSFAASHGAAPVRYGA